MSSWDKLNEEVITDLLETKQIKKRTVNTKKKGDRNEHKTAQYYRKLNYKVITTQNNSFRYNQFGQATFHAVNNDYFGLFDHIAVHNDTGDVLFIQTKTNRKPTKEYIKKLADFPAKNKILIIWHDRKKVPEIIEL